MPNNPLRNLARLFQIQSEYRDVRGQLRKASTEAVLSTLKCLGAPIESIGDVPDALRQQRQALWQRSIEPVTVAWQNLPLIIPLRLPSRLAETSADYAIVCESGERIDGHCEAAQGRKLRQREVEGADYVVRRLLVRREIPLGYHRLWLRIGDLRLESALFSAPLQAHSPRDPSGKRWGVFCPLYALKSTTNWGAGDFTDLAALARFVGEHNGYAVGTLPLLASYLDEPFDPSPYSPVSRLFWNEFYLDVTRIAEFAACAKAQERANSDEIRAEAALRRAETLVDYRKIMALKRRVIEEMLRHVLSHSPARRQEFEAFIAAHPKVQDYAAFRARVERERSSWLRWGERERDGALAPNGGDEPARLYHLYVQWQCDEQTRWLQNETTLDNAKLYLDFPLGVNRDGYDVWRERELFVLGASGGAPPDGLFLNGQNWGFPPFHPETIRRSGYRYYIDCVRHHMTYAAMLRIDHVMGMHRAFWVPEGFGAIEGLYVHYRAEEFYAVLNLESHRHRVEIVGENLGTVPEYVNQALLRHGFLGMYVGQFGVQTDPENALDSPSPETVASLDTHDTATFMGFWNGSEIDDRLALGLDRCRASRPRAALPRGPARRSLGIFT